MQKKKIEHQNWILHSETSQSNWEINCIPFFILDRKILEDEKPKEKK